MSKVIDENMDKEILQQLFKDNYDWLSEDKFGNLSNTMTEEKFVEVVSKYTEQLQSELKVTESLLNERQRLLDAIPECPVHGKCVPYALKWIEKKRRLKVITQ